MSESWPVEDEPSAELDAPEVAPVERVTFQEAWDSLDWFDEIAIKGVFRLDSTNLASEYGAAGLQRAVWFVLKRREGMDDGEAFRFVSKATGGQVRAAFADDAPEAVEPGKA